MELKIDSKTNLWKIKDKSVYTKLIVSGDVKPSKLEGFNNVKELVVIGNIYYENRIIGKPYRESVVLNNVEKLTFQDIHYFYNNNLVLKNLRIVELPTAIHSSISSSFFNNCDNLEEIIFNLITSTHKSESISLSNKNIKRIIFKYDEDEFIIKPDYKITKIDNIKYDNKLNTLDVEYENKSIRTSVSINLTDKTILKENILTNSVQAYKDEEGNFCIPDFIDKARIEYGVNNFYNISFNLKLLNANYDRYYVLPIHFLDKLKSITIRSNDEMSLFPDKKIDFKEYGTCKGLYIEKNKLYACFENNILIIDKEGKVENKELKLNKPDFILSKYSIEELEEYLLYRRFLKMRELSESNMYDEAIDDMEKKLIKKLYK